MKLYRNLLRNFMINFILWLIISLPLSFIAYDKLNREIILKQSIMAIFWGIGFAFFSSTLKKKRA